MRSTVSKNNIFTISSHVREQRFDYGVLEMDADNHLSGFREKPQSPISR